MAGQDTSATRRVLAGFDPNLATDSFGISPYGSHITLANREQIVTLMIAERVPGVESARRSPYRLEKVPS